MIITLDENAVVPLLSRARPLIECTRYQADKHKKIPTSDTAARNVGVISPDC